MTLRLKCFTVFYKIKIANKVIVDEPESQQSSSNEIITLLANRGTVKTLSPKATVIWEMGAETTIKYSLGGTKCLVVWCH